MKLKPKHIPYSHQDPLPRILPYFVAMIGILITLLTWYVLINDYSEKFFKTTLTLAIPWITLVVGISLAILCAITIRLAQLTRDRSTSLYTMDQEFQKEIAERIKAEESKQKLEIALLQGQKLQAIGTLAGGIAHDFNNILYAIKGYVEMAREDSEPSSLIYKNLGKVMEAAQRGQDLVARILAFGRRHHHHDFSPLNIKEIFENVLLLVKPAIPASVTINSEGMTADYKILGNQTQLHQVIVNIINNAVDAMDGEGTITITLSLINQQDSYLQQFPNLLHTDYCKIDISDTGHGMDQTTMERIFEPFFTTKEVGKGTGLGLATVHGIIKEHEGEITVSSQLGRGTTFTLLLPLHTGITIKKESAYGNHSTC